MGKNYKINYIFSIPKEMKDIKKASIEYWQFLKFKCDATNNIITGKRGNICGNLISFDMSKLICSLRVVLTEDKVDTELFVTGKYQDITDVNLWHFKLELILFYRTLYGLNTTDFIEEYKQYRNKAAIKWFLTNRKKGRSLEKYLLEKLESMAYNNTLPKVEIF